MADNKKFKILLIRPYFEMLRSELGFLPFEPLGIMYLKAAALAAGHEAEIYDCLVEHPQQIVYLPEKNVYRCGSSDEQIIKKIKAYQPDIVGISGMFYSQSASFNALAKLVKSVSRDILVIGGGAFPSSYGRKTLEDNPDFDLVVYGEGELTFVDLLNNLKNLSAVNGIFYRDKISGEIKETPPREINCQLDNLPLPARDFSKLYNYSKPVGYNYSDKFDLKKAVKRLIFYTVLSLPLARNLAAWLFNYQHRRSVKALYMPHGFIITSRGCPQRCTFCAIHKVWGKNYRMRSAASVIEEIKTLLEHGVKEIVIVDDNFTVSKQRTMEICHFIIDSGYQVRLMAPSGVYIPTLDEEILTALYQAGLRELNFGVENGDQDFLNRVVRKNLDLDQAKRTIAIAKKVGLRTIAFLMFGYPGETKETMLATLRFAFESGVDSARFYVFQPFPNTEAFQMAVEMKAIDEHLDFLRLKAMTDKPQLTTDEFKPEDVKKIYDLAYDILKKRNYNEVKDRLREILGWG